MLAGGGYLSGAVAPLFMLLPMVWLGLLYRHALITTPAICASWPKSMTAWTRLIYSGTSPAPSPISTSSCCRQDPHRASGGWTMPPSPAGSGGVHLKTASSEASADIAEQDIPPSRWRPPSPRWRPPPEIACNIQETDTTRSPAGQGPLREHRQTSSWRIPSRG